jgi:hypothetical protein
MKPIIITILIIVFTIILFYIHKNVKD